MTAEPLPNFRCKRDLHVPEASAKIFFGVGSRPHKARCYKTIKGISWNFKFCWFFFMLRVPPATLQLSRQNSSRGGDPGSCSRIDSFLLHPLEPPLPLEAVWGHFPIWKITAGDQPLDLLEDLRGEMGFFLAIKIFKQKLWLNSETQKFGRNVWVYWLCLHLDTFWMMQALSIPTEAQIENFPVFFSDGWGWFSQRSQLIQCVCFITAYVPLEIKSKQS